MQFIPSDPDIQTIVSRISDGSLDLQPEFQRGEVWSVPKQRLLVDSIVRGWHIPPIHVIRLESAEQVVLDGQQRLRAIHDFTRGLIRVDGYAEPESADIKALNGLRYDELPDKFRRAFDRFTIRVFELTDYSPEEPSELFYRLNQPTTLTGAEKRNAFFGAARDEIAALTEYAESVGMTSERIGFSNARLAHEDLIARFVWTLENGSLLDKVTATVLTKRYREARGFEDRILGTARDAITMVFGAPSLKLSGVRLNRAMAYSWLCFAARAALANQELTEFDDFLRKTEIARTRSGRAKLSALSRPTRIGLEILDDRATSRVNDVSSVVLRDAVLWCLYCHGRSCADERIKRLRENLTLEQDLGDIEESLLRGTEDLQWGILP